jgi:hypothetical protein
LGAFTHFLYDDARCGLKPTRWRCRVFFTKETMGHWIQEEPARRDREIMPPSASIGPLKKNCLHHPPHTPTKFTKKLAAFRALANCHGPHGAIRRRGLPQSWCGGELPTGASSNYPDASHHGSCQL